MPVKNFPADLKNLLATGWCKSYPALEITLGDGTQLFLSTIGIEFDGTEYTNKLTRVGALRTSITQTADRCEIELNNATGEFGQALVDAADALDNAKATLYRIYVNLDDDTEKYLIERLSGTVVTVPNKGAGDETVTLELRSDAFAGGPVVDAEVRRTCVWRYKDPTTCGYSGGLPSCDLTYDGTNGCVVHFGEEMARARYGGHGLFLDEQTIRTLNPNGSLTPQLPTGDEPRQIPRRGDELPDPIRPDLIY